MYTKILHGDISIVVQGAIEKQHTATCLSIFNYMLPDAEIILSTWTGSDVSGLNYDMVVFSEDPGAIVVDGVTGTLNNVNRQLVTTQAGLRKATRRYILKTRTDILFYNADFLSYFLKYDDKPSAYFKARLLICNYYTRNPRIFDTCFHPSDWMVFGFAEDVCSYFENISLMSGEELNWFKTHEKKSTFFTNYISRFTPEQHIFLQFLTQKEGVCCDCYYDHKKSQIVQTERAFAECFVVLDYQKQMGITFLKYDPNRYLEAHTLLTHWQWKALYSHYCKRELSFLWVIYLVRAQIMLFSTKLRKLCICLLAAMGIKEKVKNMLSKRGHMSK